MYSDLHIGVENSNAKGAAAHARMMGKVPRDIDVQALRDDLRRVGALVD